jgi:hypothetical protein
VDLLPASWQAAHLPALTGAQQAAVESAVSVGAAPVTSSTPPEVARVITDISHATFASGMHTAFLVAAAVALAGALIGLPIRPGHATALRSRGADLYDRRVPFPNHGGRWPDAR